MLVDSILMRPTDKTVITPRAESEHETGLTLSRNITHELAYGLSIAGCLDSYILFKKRGKWQNS
jgi:hypothetical protein